MSSARSLFQAAREDAPDDPSRDAMWDRLSHATGAAVATAAASQVGAAKVAAAGAGGGMKLLAIGGMIGAVSTALGVVVALNLTSTSPARSTALVAQPARVHAVARGATLADPAPRRLDPLMTIRAEEPPLAPSTDAPPTTSVVPAEATDDLAEEARLLTAARSALVGGDPSRALSLVQATRRLGTRALEPEELGLEARALRALGRADEAAATELLLRRRYPAHALAR